MKEAGGATHSVRFRMQDQSPTNSLREKGTLGDVEAPGSITEHPDFMREYESRGHSVHVDAESRVIVQARLIR